ncbi:MAG: hypothetical protein JXA90_03135 [Planctomycetes bacterium]|nr:hypothetical protein [Planctomycetota bacterium]
MTLDLQAILIARADEQVCSLRGRGALDEDDPAPDPAPAPRLCDRCRARLRKGNASGICGVCNKNRRLCNRCHTEHVHKDNRSGICWVCFERGERPAALRARKYRRLCVRCHTERIHRKNRSGICGACFGRGER